MAMTIVNGKPLTSFPLYLDEKKKVYVLDLPPRLVDEELGLHLEAFHGSVRIRQKPDENIEIELVVYRNGIIINVWGTAYKGYTYTALGIQSERVEESF